MNTYRLLLSLIKRRLKPAATARSSRSRRLQPAATSRFGPYPHDGQCQADEHAEDDPQGLAIGGVLFRQVLAARWAALGLVEDDGHAVGTRHEAIVGFVGL